MESSLLAPISRLPRTTAATVILLVLHVFPLAWVTDLMAYNGQGMMGGSSMGQGMMPGERMCPMGGQMSSVPFSPLQLPEPDSKGAVLFKTYCAQCHALPSPKSHTPAHWEGAFNRMFARMRTMEREKQSPRRWWMPGVKGPSDEEAISLLAYLKRHGLRPAPENIAAEWAGLGASLFNKACSQCHALPHPAQHTPQEWSVVVDRMRGHLIRQGTLGIDDWAAEQIVTFLAQSAGSPGTGP
jgi:cytochrome c2